MHLYFTFPWPNQSAPRAKSWIWYYSERVPYENTITFNDEIFSMSTVLINPRFNRDDVYVCECGQNTWIILITQHEKVPLSAPQSVSMFFGETLSP